MNPSNTLTIAIGNNIDINGHSPSQTVSLNTWHQVGMIYTGSTEYAVVDGVLYQLATGLSGNSPLTSTVVATGIGGALGTSVKPSWPFAGQIADVQQYNFSLSAAQVNSSYYAGPLGGPASQTGLVGWWPLNGNPNDYSGNANNGQSSNVTYQTVASLTDSLFARNGTALSNVPVGFVISSGVASGGSGGAGAQGKSRNGAFNAIVSYNSIKPNATVYSFVGNLSSAANVIGWWPLSFGDLGRGTVYDISAGNDSITSASNVVWSPWRLGRRFSAGSFPGNGVQTSLANYGVITVSALGALQNITTTNNFTAVAWVKYNGGASQQSCEGIFGSGGVTGSGFQMVARTPNANCGIAYIGGNSLQGNYITPLYSLNWTMVSLSFNKASGTATVFENSSVAYSTNGLGGYNVAPTGGLYYIGAANSLGGNTFNGMISNVQIYSQTLTTQQISLLYSQGPTGIPVRDRGWSGGGH